ncbi:hypothetical protein X801_01845 [Opisthorchis viverrini]|uniref:Uncharacterized protein n=1 Tax=Opisthorchis viverrini TaxID=6198 RepID=A0A1S8X6A3_OPIVI|nr:hypothetical protein X801_01845 [Opisthorchis viverrini]
MSEMFVSDLQISAGYGQFGYPWMGTLNWSGLFNLWTGDRVEHSTHSRMVHSPRDRFLPLVTA